MAKEKEKQSTKEHPENITQIACPFCAETRVEQLKTTSADNPKFDVYYWLFCRACGASGPTCTSPEEAVRKWNHRQMYDY